VPDNTPKIEQGATPPGEGRQNHAAMRAGSLLPLSGQGSTDTIAASGGLELPGGERGAEHVASVSPTHEPIPGERDPSTQFKR
jgi:hypothetical protein